MRKAYIKYFLFIIAVSFFLREDITAQHRFTKYTDAQIEAKIDSILAIMTIEEKAGQLNQLTGPQNQNPNNISDTEQNPLRLVREGKIGSFLNVYGADVTREYQRVAVEETRAKIPLIFGFDVIHGFKTTFPVPLAEAASWDPALVEKSATVQALEASSAGLHWTFSPMVDIARDPRWGRIVEGSGEDPYLGSAMAAARTKGYQKDPNFGILACVKHFAAYGGAEGGRDYNTVDMSERTLREVYLPPYKAAVDAGALTVMCSFNEIGGVPSSASRFLMTDVLRNEWGFNGFVVSDWTSIAELIQHGVAADGKDAARLAINAGCDMDMESRLYVSQLKSLVESGEVSKETLDEALRRVLRVKFLYGLFEDPYKNCSVGNEKANTLTKANMDASLEAAKNAIVLLKNENNLLPLKNYKSVAVIGPLADSRREPLGAWDALSDSTLTVTLLQGIKNHVPQGTKIDYALGCGITGDNKSGFAQAVELAKKSDMVVLALGERALMSGEANNRASIELPGVQEELAEEIYKTGKPVVVVLMNGRPLGISWIAKNIPAVVEGWFLGSQAGNALGEVLFGKFNPCGKLPVTFPHHEGQIPFYYNHKNTGRPQPPDLSRYQDLPQQPLYPFGHGLSYTKFEYSNFTLSSKTIGFNEELTAKVTVKNTGSYDGAEVVQLYIRDLVGSVTRPVKELKRFEKIFLKKGEEKTVEFKLTSDDLRFYGLDMKFAAEPGKFKIFAGGSSENVLEQEFELVKK
jgi:beta-glucosidase